MGTLIFLSLQTKLWVLGFSVPYILSYGYFDIPFLTDKVMGTLIFLSLQTKL